MVAPSVSMLGLCLLPRTEAAIGFDGVVAAFASSGGVCGSNDGEELDVGVLA
jgi:hypothetical protein